MANQKQYIVSARKYRPATFQTVVGQKALTSTLKNAILGGKLAQAYLFCGPRGVGKTSCARIFAKTINCMNPTVDGEACGECESCKAIERGSSFNLVELDAASNNSVENIRKITDQVNVPAQDGRYRVFIIDEVHMLSNAAFNAFLKTLEEPPKNVVFILATTERHKVIPTILSRCQVYDFRRITVNDIIDHLQFVAQNEGVIADREALGVIALKADGAMRDALSIFDQVVASTQGHVSYQSTIESLNVLDQEYYFRLVDVFKSGDVASALLIFKEITDKGFDALFFINGLAEHVRNLMVSVDPRTVSLLQTSEDWAKKYALQAPQLPKEWYYSAIKILNDTDYNYRLATNKRLLVELSLIRLSRLLSGPQTIPSSTPNASPQPSATNTSQSSYGAPFAAPDGNKPQPDPAIKPEAVSSQKSGVNLVAKPENYGISRNDRGQVSVSANGKSDIKRKPTERPTSFRLNSEKKKTSIKNVRESQNNPFSPEQFYQAWEDFANSHPEQRILVAAMRSSRPERSSDTIYKVSVDHPAQKQAFESMLPDMLDYFKRKLDNDFITLTVEVSEKTEAERGMNTKEFLKLVVSENPELAKFLKAVDAELE